MQTSLRFASAFSVVAFVACASPSSATDDLDVQEAAVTAGRVSFVGRSGQELRADLRAALGKAPSPTEDATVPGVLSIRQGAFDDELTFSGTTWDLDRSLDEDGTLDFVFPSFFDSPEARTDRRSARKLFDAMTNATIKTTPTIVGQDVTRTSPAGLIACTAKSSVHFEGERHWCRIKGIEGVSLTRGAP